MIFSFFVYTLIQYLYITSLESPRKPHMQICVCVFRYLHGLRDQEKQWPKCESSEKEPHAADKLWQNRETTQAHRRMRPVWRTTNEIQNLSSIFIVCLGSPQGQFSFPETDRPDSHTDCAISKRPVGTWSLFTVMCVCLFHMIWSYMI